MAPALGTKTNCSSLEQQIVSELTATNGLIEQLQARPSS
jgi:hypothetical protein